MAAIARSAGLWALLLGYQCDGVQAYYPWNTIKHAVCLPHSLRIMEYHEFAAFNMINSDQISEIDYQHNELPATEGFDCVYTLAHRALSLPGSQMTLELMAASYRNVGTEWNLT